MLTLLTLIPLGIVGCIRWLSWSFRRLVSMFYRPTLPGHLERMSVVVPVYQEDPDILRRAIESWLANEVDEILLVIDVTDPASMAVGAEFAQTGIVTVLPTDIPGKRDALAVGWRSARHPIVALVDSDTIWDEGVRNWVCAPFSDPDVGGVGTRQNVWLPRGLWQNAADVYLDYRYFDEIPAQSAIGQAVSCLSGRTAVYRRELLVKMEKDFLSETFLGVQCMSGDDKRLTTLLLESGYKTIFQREARVWSTFPPTLRKFILQRVRWARNTWRSDLRAMGSGWIWKHKFLAYTTVDKAISSFTLLIAPTFLTIALVTHHWRVALILVVWWLVSRSIKLLPHLRRRPRNILLLPAFIGITIMMALVKIYALATIRQQRWLTRDVAVVDGVVQRTSGASDLEPEPAGSTS